MRNHRRYVMLAPALALVVTFAAPTVEAGGGVSLHLGAGGFGVSVGFGDWGVYTRSWSDPYWSIDFNATLAGYGEWVWVSGLGRVWRPWVAASWRPYTHGRWVSTSCGMTWVAYEPWGYVPHHYGNWAHASFGWVWVPGYSYSCANVVWVGTGRHVGWYARPPSGWSHAHHGFRHGYRHGFRDGYDSGYDDGWRDARYATYVDWRHFGSDNVSRHAVTHSIASQNRIEARAEAPSRDEIRLRGGATITETRLSRRSARVDGREVTVARPEGVVPSIERNAAETVGRSLSEEALTRRQPLVRSRTASALSASSSSRSASVSQNTRSSQVRRTGTTTQSSDDRPSTARSADTRTHAQAFVPVLGVRQDPDDSRRTRPRTFGDSGVTSYDRSQSAPSISPRSRSAATSRQVARQPQQRSQPQQQQGRAVRPTAESRQAPPTGQPTAETRRSQPRTETSRRASEKKDSEEPSPRRRR